MSQNQNKPKSKAKKVIVGALGVSALVGLGFLAGNKTARTKLVDCGKNAVDWVKGKLGTPAPKVEDDFSKKKYYEGRGYGRRDYNKPHYNNNK